MQKSIFSKSRLDLHKTHRSRISVHPYFLSSMMLVLSNFFAFQVTLGLGGVFIVLLSVGASIGIFGFVGVSATLIIFEIIPFLVLAVGVDNIFILVQTYQRDIRRPSETLPEHVGRVVGEVAPSMLLSSASEATCFFLGKLICLSSVRPYYFFVNCMNYR